MLHAAENVARLARNVDWVTRLAPNLSGDQRPAADSLGALSSSQTDLAANGFFEYGVVIDAIPLTRCYRVAPDGGGPAVDCAKGMSGPVAPIGAYDADTLVVGTHVRFMRLPFTTSGLIISTEPMYMWNPTKAYGDGISMGSNTGLKAESGLQEPLNMGGTQKSGTIDMCGGITDWSGRTPFDSLEIGEFNRTSELGLMLHLDSYMTFLRADEYTGIWAYYWDGLCRIAGQQFQEWAGPSEREVYDDEGETVYYHGVATYPWEHQGMLTGPRDASSVLTADDVQNTAPHYAGIEPTHDDLQPFHRFRLYRGYLGQGEKKLVCSPILTMGGGGTMQDEMRYSDCYYMPIGLHEQQIMMSGHLGMRSALGVTIAKRPVIPTPKRCEIVTSADGDTAANYKQSGYYGVLGSDHKIQATPSPDAGVTDDELHLYRANTIMDLHAHLFNWEGEHPFYYHQWDYKLHEESEYEHVTSNQDVPIWDDLESEYQWYLDVAGYDAVEYDHRAPAVNVYRNTAYFTITDEGGICIGDGWGSEIRMAGGCIFLECPGDVFLAPGRNMITWGGRDICLRAWNSIDITTSECDIRIKAEENLNLGGGIGGGPYGVFIEARSDANTDGAGGSGPCGTQGQSYYGWGYVGEVSPHTGIVMKAANSEIVGWSRNVYLMTRMADCLGKSDGYSSVCPTQPKEGDIVLDTKGYGDIITRSDFVKHWVKCAVMHAFPDSPSIRQVNLFTEVGATLCGDVYIDGDLLNYGSHLANNDVISCAGHFYSSQGGVVAKANTGAACTSISEGHTYEATLRTWSTTAWGVDLNTMWYETGRPGNIYTVRSAWFDLRVEEDYMTQAFTLWEARWQQMARENGDTVREWTENPVESNRSTGDWQYTLPFPGYQRLSQDDDAYKKTTNKLYDTTTGLAEDRGATYESPVTLNAPTASIIDGNYYHIGKLRSPPVLP